MRLAKALKYFYLLFWPSLGAMYYAVCIDFLDLMQGQKLREHKIMFCLCRFMQCVYICTNPTEYPKDCDKAIALIQFCVHGNGILQRILIELNESC